MKEDLILEVGLSKEAEKTFAPGNLVIGSFFRQVSPEFFLNGITTPKNAGLSNSNHPNMICATMLDTSPMPGRYLDTLHHGPRGYARLSALEREDGTPWKVGIIVSLTEILAKFPRQVYAVGSSFNNDSWWRHLLNKYHHRFPDYSQFGQFVSNIPIIRINEGTYSQEVRIYPNDPDNAYITPQMWTGVVTNSPESLLDFLEKHSLTLDVPLFDEDVLDIPIHLRNLR